jgi:hypothetical protein
MISYVIIKIIYHKQNTKNRKSNTEQFNFGILYHESLVLYNLILLLPKFIIIFAAHIRRHL